MRSRTPVDDQASTGDGPAASLVMSTMRSGTPSVYPETDREASPGIITTIAVSEEPRGDPALDGASTPRVGAATPDSKVETSNDGRGRPPIGWGQGIQIRPSIYLPRPSESGPSPAAPVDDASRLIISHSSVSDAITRLQKRALLSSLNHLMRLGSLFSCREMIAEQQHTSTC